MNLLEPVLRHARRDPEAPAVGGPDGTASYGELVTYAGALAAGYREHGVEPGDRVAVLAAPGRDALAAALAAFLCRAAYVPIDPAQPPARVRAMLTGCAPRLCVRAGAGSEDAGLAGPGVPVLSPPALAGRWQPADPAWLARAEGGAPDEVAYVIHTSGSTGVPKAIEVEHGGVANLLAELDRRAPVADGHTGAWWCGPDFDVAVWEQWSPLCRGGQVLIVPPAARWDGASLANFLDQAAVTSAYVPAAFLADLLDRLTGQPGSCAALRRLLVGVEPIPLGLLQRIARARPELTVVNGYGPAEATICCTLYVVPPAGGDPLGRTPIGTPVTGNRVTVLGPDGAPSPDGTGELVVSGIGVARGYLGATGGAGTGFVPDPGGEPGARAYRTGDLVRTLPDGCLVFEGRVDRQLKVRGHRVEPGEVETAVRAVASPRDVVVGLREVPGLGPAVVAYLVPGTHPAGPRELRERLRQVLPWYALPAAVIPIDAVPLTEHGKIDHGRLARLPLPPPPEPAEPAEAAPAACLAGAERTPPAACPPGVEPAVTGLLDTVVDAWGRELRVAEPAAGSFVGLGGASLAAARVAATLRATTGLAVSAADVLAAESAADLAGRLAAADLAGRLAAGRPPAEVVPAAGRTIGPLSPNQLGLWLHDQLDADRRTYLEPVCFALDGPVDEVRLADAVRRAATAHPAFGAVVEVDTDDQPRLVLGRCRIQLRVAEPPGASARGGKPEPAGPAGPPGPVGPALAAAIRAELTKPFDLEEGPLMRCLLLPSQAGPSHLLLVWHHIVVDGWSVRLFLDDLARCYRDPDHQPRPEPVTLCDANAWLDQHSREAAMVAKIRRAAAGIRDYPLAAHRPAPPAGALDGAGTAAGDTGGRGAGAGPVQEVSLDPATVRQLNRASAGAGLTPYAFICTAYQDALASALGTDRFLIGCAVAGRVRPEFERVAGYFVNTVLVRSTPKPKPKPKPKPGRESALTPAPLELARLAQVAAEIEDARAGQEDIPFAQLVAQLRAEGRAVPPRMPQLYLSLDDEYTLALDGLRVLPYPVRVPRAKFAATLVLRGCPRAVSGYFEYHRGLLTDREAARLVDTFLTRLRALARSAAPGD